MDYYEILEQKIKNWVENEFKFAISCKGITRESLISYKGICFGAIFFTANVLFPTYNENLANWWENEMMPKFDKAIKER